MLQMARHAILKEWYECTRADGSSTIAEELEEDARIGISVTGVSWQILPVYRDDAVVGMEDPGPEYIEESRRACIAHYIATTQEIMKISGFPPVLSIEYLGIENRNGTRSGAGLGVHRGPTNENWKLQTALVVPPECATKRCRTNVGDVSLPWSEGYSHVLNDAFEHGVEMEARGARWLMEVSFCRPDLRPEDEPACMYQICRRYARADRPAPSQASPPTTLGAPAHHDAIFRLARPLVASALLLASVAAVIIWWRCAVSQKARRRPKRRE